MFVSAIITRQDTRINKTDDEKVNDEEKWSEESSVTSKEAKAGLRAVLKYLQNHNIDDSVFGHILKLDNTIDQVSASSYIQKEITCFLKKN